MADRTAYWPRLTWLALFGAAFGFVEAAVVIYLHRIYYPAGFGFPLILPELPLLKVELARELCTLVMLLAVAMLAERRAWARFGVFCFLFGVWDLVYYLGLWWAIGWPPSLWTWDALFLLPTLWVGPVFTAVAVAASLTVAGAIIVRKSADRRPYTPWWVWLGSAGAFALLLVAFMGDEASVRATGTPHDFPWAPYLIGLVLGWAMFGTAFLSLRTEYSPEP